jgi:hypothetical protein
MTTIHRPVLRLLQLDPKTVEAPLTQLQNRLQHDVQMLGW